MKKRFINLATSMVLLVCVIICGSSATYASTYTKNITSMTMPTSITMKVGESRTLEVKANPIDTTNVYNTYWGYSSSYVTTSDTTYGTYWGTDCKCKVTALYPGTAYVTATVNVYDNNSTSSRQLKTISLECKVTITGKDSSTSTTKPATTSGKYISVTNAYKELRTFRSLKKIWYWNKDNKTRTYFNTKKSNTLRRLVKSDKLEATAKVRAKEISRKFSHTRPNGKDCFTAYPSTFTYRGENIAMGYTTSKAVTKAWKERDYNYSGQGHRRNMLNKKFKYVGIACYEVDGVRYWVQCFGN